MRCSYDEYALLNTAPCSERLLCATDMAIKCLYGAFKIITSRETYPLGTKP